MKIYIVSWDRKIGDGKYFYEDYFSDKDIAIDFAKKMRNKDLYNDITKVSVDEYNSYNGRFMFTSEVKHALQNRQEENK